MPWDGTCEKQSPEKSSLRGLLPSHFKVNLGIAGTGWPLSATAKDTFFPQVVEGEGACPQKTLADVIRQSSVAQSFIAVQPFLQAPVPSVTRQAPARLLLLRL